MAGNTAATKSGRRRQRYAAFPSQRTLNCVLRKICQPDNLQDWSLEALAHDLLKQTSFVNAKRMQRCQNVNATTAQNLKPTAPAQRLTQHNFGPAVSAKQALHRLQ
jgi:endo-beta-N-acetylglucosaminidase D